MAMKYNLVLVVLLVLVAIASAVQYKKQIVVYGRVLCSESFEQCEDVSAPPFANATVILWDGGTVNKATTNETGFFQVDVSIDRHQMFIELLCMLKVITPLSQCNPNLTTKGFLSSEIQLVDPAGKYKAKCFEFYPLDLDHTNVAYAAEA